MTRWNDDRLIVVPIAVSTVWSQASSAASGVSRAGPSNPTPAHSLTVGPLQLLASSVRAKTSDKAAPPTRRPLKMWRDKLRLHEGRAV